MAESSRVLVRVSRIVPIILGFLLASVLQAKVVYVNKNASGPTILPFVGLVLVSFPLPKRATFYMTIAVKNINTCWIISAVADQSVIVTVPWTGFNTQRR